MAALVKGFYSPHRIKRAPKRRSMKEIDSFNSWSRFCMSFILGPNRIFFIFDYFTKEGLTWNL